VVYSLHIPQISRKSNQNVLSYPTNKQTYKQTNGGGNSTTPVVAKVAVYIGWSDVTVIYSHDMISML